MWRNIAAVTVVVMALAASWQAFEKISDGASRAPSEMAQVIIAREDLPQGVILTEGMLEAWPIPRKHMQHGAYEVHSISDMNLPLGLAAAVRIPKGDQVTQNCLVNPAPPKSASTADRKQLSQRSYVEGLKYFQNSDYERARAEWKLAMDLDPSNANAAAGLDRVKQVLARDR